jgi:predicted metal-dependent peptidase
MGAIESKRLRDGLKQLVMMQPFWGTLALHMELVRDDKIETLSTDGKRIRYNKPFCDSLSVGLCAFCIAHEVSHPFLHHLDRPFKPCPHHGGKTFGRAKGGRVWHWHPDVWNCAGDYVINLMLREAGFQLWPKCLISDEYKKMTTEQVYKEICPPILDMKCSGCGGSGKSDGEDGEQCPACGGSGDGSGMPQPDPITGHDLDPDGPAEDFSQQEFSEIVTKAATIAKAQGRLPASVQGLIKEATEPQYPVYMLLEQFIDEAIRDEDMSWKRPHRDFMSRGIIMPDYYSERVSHVVLVYDTSGSVPDSDLSRFHRVGGDVIRRLKPKKLTVMQVDARLHSVTNVERESDWPREIKCTGRGGTSFKPPFVEVAKKNMQPSCLVYLTDMMGDFPERRPLYPVLWISTTKDAKGPFGMTVHFNG